MSRRCRKVLPAEACTPVGSQNPSTGLRQASRKKDAGARYGHPGNHALQVSLLSHSILSHGHKVSEGLSAKILAAT
jgi:hypothetical protein